MPEVLGTDPGDGISGDGTTLSGATSGAIGMVTKIQLDGLETGVIDITTMNSPSKWRKFIAGLKDAKSLTLDLNYQKDNALVLHERIGLANELWTIAFPDATSFVCSGFINKVGAMVPMEDKMTQSVTIKLSGIPVYQGHSGT